MNLLNKILIVALLIALAASFIGGCQYGKTRKKCPQITSDTVLVYDTVDHYIYNIWPWYIQGKDTTIYDTVPQDVDTALILRDYFARRIYPDRNWKNDTVDIHVTDTISQNRLMGNSMRYRIKIPFTQITNTTDNTITYNRYLYFGVNVPIKNVNYVELETTYNWEKGYLGASYSPQLNSFGIKGGATIIKFKKRK
jgi:hypothetical protein